MIPPSPAFATTAFRSTNQRSDALRRAGELAGCRYQVIGHTESGRPIEAVRFGDGPRRATLIAGSHADEPVGPETLALLVDDVCARTGMYAELLNAYTLLVVPHVNPDGEERNRPWIDRWPSLAAYLTGAVRERPGRDIEFGYPDLRAENEAVAAAMSSMAPLSLHMSLHGMGYSDGVMLLIDRYWGFRAQGVREGFKLAARRSGLLLHDHNRMGEKGFFQIEPGFTTTPEGAAMRAYFNAAGDPATAGEFRDSSMEYARHLGGDPLCVVTELPLFLVEGSRQPGLPAGYLEFKAQTQDLRARLQSGHPAADVLGGFSVRPLELQTAVELQWETIRLSLLQVP